MTHQAAEHAGEGLPRLRHVRILLEVGGRHLARGVHRLVGLVEEEALGRVVRLDDLLRALREQVRRVWTTLGRVRQLQGE